MEEKTIIVHSDHAEHCLARPRGLWPRAEQEIFEKHVELILQVRQRERVSELDSMTDPAAAGQLVENGDEVVLYGLFRDWCIWIAEKAMTDKGAVVKYGTEPFSII